MFKQIYILKNNYLKVKNNTSPRLQIQQLSRHNKNPNSNLVTQKLLKVDNNWARSSDISRDWTSSRIFGPKK